MDNNNKIEFIINKVISKIAKYQNDKNQGTNEVNNKLLQVIREHIYRQLIKINKNDIKSITLANVYKIIEQIYDKYQNAKIDSGKLVGVVAGQSLGEIITQSTLNTFHFSGISSGRKQVSGLARMQEILQVTKNPKQTNMRINLSTKKTLQELIKLKATLKYTILTDLVKDYNINYTTIYDKEQWVRIYKTFFKFDTTNQPKLVLRLYLDIDKLYMYKYTLKFISNILINKYGENIRCIYSDMSLGIIDIYYKSDIMTDKPDNETDDVIKSDISKKSDIIDLYDYSTNIINTDLYKKLQNLWYYELSNTYISGVSDIEDLYPTSIKLNQVIIDMVLQTDKTDNVENYKYIYKIILNDNLIQEYNISFNEISTYIISQLDNQASINIDGYLYTNYNKYQIDEKLNDLSVKINKIIIKNGNDYYNISNDNIIVTFNKQIINKYKLYLNDIFVLLSNYKYNFNHDSYILTISNISDFDVFNTFFTNFIDTDIYSFYKQDLNDHYYFDSVGTNFYDLFLLDYIDHNSLTTSDIYHFYLIYGIDACREYLLEQLISSSGNINITHAILLADAMCYNFKPTSVTRHGYSDNISQPLPASSFEENTENFLYAAAMGSTDPLSSMAGSIITGKLSEMGSNFNQISYDKPKFKPKFKSKKLKFKKRFL
jgi:hypothetical protein